MADLWGVVLGGVLTLAGGSVTQLIQSAEKLRERRSTRNALLRTKAEELFSAIAELRASVHSHIHDKINNSSGVPSFYSPLYAKIYAICATYFPETIQFFQNTREEVGRALDALETANLSDDDHRRELVRIPSDAVANLCSKVEERVCSIL